MIQEVINIKDKPDFERLCTSRLCDELTLKECQELANIMGATHLKDRELLVAEGDMISTLFILISGKLAVSSMLGGNNEVVYIMREDECAGTRAFVDRTPRKATLRAIGDATVYTLEPEAFEALLATNPGIVYKIMRTLFRITHTNLTRMNQERRELSNYISKAHGRY